MRCPSWWKIFWFTVLVMNISTLPHIGIEERTHRIVFAVLTIPFFAIVVTLIYIWKIIWPLRQVNDQLKRAARQFERAITHNSTWSKPETKTSPATLKRRKKGKKRLKRARKGGASTSSVNVSFNENGESTTSNANASAARNPYGDEANAPNGFESSSVFVDTDDDGDGDDTINVRASPSEGGGHSDTDGGYSNASGAEDGEASSAGASPAGSTAGKGARGAIGVASVVLTTRDAWDYMASHSKPSSGLPEVFDLQKRVIKLFDLYFALLLAHEVRIKAKDMNKLSLLLPREVNILQELRIELEDKAAAAQLAALKNEGPAAPNSPTLNIPTQLKVAGVLNPVLEIPFFLKRGTRFAGDTPAVAFYVSRSSDSYVVGYSANVEALTPQGSVMGSAALERLRGNPTPPPLTFDGGRRLEPMRGDWYTTGGAQFTSGGVGGGAGRGRATSVVPATGGGSEESGGTLQTPLNFFERRFGYGVALSPLTLCPAAIDERVIGAASAELAMAAVRSDGAVRHCSRVSVTLQVLNGKSYTLVMAKCHVADTFAGDGCADASGMWAPVLVGHVNSVLCVVESAHITSRPPQRFWQMPTVEAIEIKGLSLENRGGSISLGSWVTERIELVPPVPSSKPSQ